MIDILVYADGSSQSDKVLDFAIALQQRLEANLTFINIRREASTLEEPPPIGRPIPVEIEDKMPTGIKILINTAQKLVQKGVLEPSSEVQIRETPNGYLFIGKTPAGNKIPFYACFGHFIEILNHMIEQSHYKLFIISMPPPNRLKRLLAQSVTRKLALDLHTSLLVVRGGGPDSRYLICADGSPSARRQFPLLKYLLPAITGPIEIAWYKDENAEPSTVKAAEHCLDLASGWLDSEGKEVTVHRLTGQNRLDTILKAAGGNSVICLGASLRHDVYRRMKGSLPIQILTLTTSSVLLAKLPPEADEEMFKKPFTC